MSGFEELIGSTDAEFNEVLLSIPTNRIESWKYVPTRILSRTSWSPAEVRQSSNFALSGGEFLNIPENLDSLPNFTKDETTRMEEFRTAHGFNGIHHALQKKTCVLTCRSSSETYLELHRLANQAKSAGFASLLLRIQANAQLTLVERFERKVIEAQNLDSFAIFLTVEPDAHVTHIRFQQSNDQAYQFTSLDVRLSKNSSYFLTTIDFGGKLARSDIHIRLSGKNAEAKVNGLALTSDSQYHDTHLAIDHEVNDTRSSMTFRNMVNDKGEATFNGRVLIKKHAQQSATEQSVANLLLSKTARVNPKPELEIYADNVTASHGCTVGTLDENELFYLTSRGLSKEEASGLLQYAFAESILDEIPDDKTREIIEKQLLGELKHGLLVSEIKESLSV